MFNNLKSFLKNKRTIFFLKLILAGFLVFFLIIKIEWLVVWENVINLPIYLVILYIFFLLLGIFISAYKWKTLANFQGFHYSLKNFFSWYLTGTFLNNFMPSTIGGDAYRAISLGKTDKDGYAKASSTVFIDRLTGIFGLLFLTTVFSFFNWQTASQSQILFMLYLGALVGVIFVFLILYFKKIPYQRKLKKIVPKKISHYLQRINDYRDKQILGKAFQFSLLFALVGVASSNYILFLAVGETIPLINYLGVIFLISLIASVPMTIGNIGVKEWAYVAFFGLFGVSATTAVTVVLLSRLLQMIISLFGVPLYLQDKKKIERRNRKMQ